MPEEDFSAVCSSGLCVSCEISHGSPQSFRPVLTVACRVFFCNHRKLKRTPAPCANTGMPVLTVVRCETC